MKKILFILSTCFLFDANVLAQTTTPTEAPATETQKQADFDKKFRFGLRATPQPSWLKSNNTGSKGSGAVFGFGFGLTMEFRLSDIVHFQTGIGGDFEGGWITYRNDAEFNAKLVVDKENEMVEAKDELKSSEYELVNGSTQYIMNERKYKTTFVTIPVLLKMMTQEYSGMKYFMMFGGELGIRAGVKANDTYAQGIKTVITGTTLATNNVTELTRDNINLGKDASLAPLRIGMNLGLGTEYRIAGSTSLVMSINYFQSFTNLMRKDSEFITKGIDNTYSASTGWSFAPLNQGLTARAIRINIGIMF
jgi:hypothetical protein